MELDRKLQRRVWSRVYGAAPHPQPRQQIENARRRQAMNLRFFESRKNDPIYGAAYAHMADLSRQIIAMLKNL